MLVDCFVSLTVINLFLLGSSESSGGVSPSSPTSVSNHQCVSEKLLEQYSRKERSCLCIRDTEIKAYAIQLSSKTLFLEPYCHLQLC